MSRMLGGPDNIDTYACVEWVIQKWKWQ